MSLSRSREVCDLDSKDEPTDSLSSKSWRKEKDVGSGIRVSVRVDRLVLVGLGLVELLLLSTLAVSRIRPSSSWDMRSWDLVLLLRLVPEVRLLPDVLKKEPNALRCRRSWKRDMIWCVDRGINR